MRVSGRNQPVRHRIVWVVEDDLDRCLDVGPKHQVSSGIGLDASAATCLLSIKCPAVSDVGVLDAGPARMCSCASTLITSDAEPNCGADQQGSDGGSDAPDRAEIGPTASSTESATDPRAPTK